MLSQTQLIKGLEAARGNGTSMISLIMPPKDQVNACSRRPPLLPPHHADAYQIGIQSATKIQLPFMLTNIIPFAGVAGAKDAGG